MSLFSCQRMCMCVVSHGLVCPNVLFTSSMFYESNQSRWKKMFPLKWIVWNSIIMQCKMLRPHTLPHRIFLCLTAVVMVKEDISLWVLIFFLSVYFPITSHSLLHLLHFAIFLYSIEKLVKRTNCYSFSLIYDGWGSDRLIDPLQPYVLPDGEKEAEKPQGIKCFPVIYSCPLVRSAHRKRKCCSSHIHVTLLPPFSLWV